MIRSPLAKPGRFWRRNLHCLSARPDGAFPTEVVARRCRAKGWRFAGQPVPFMEGVGHSITDTTAFRTVGFAKILGAGLHAPALANGENSHLPAWACPPNLPPTH